MSKIKFLLRTTLALLATNTLIGCTMPGGAQNEIVKAQSDAAMDVILDNQLKEGVNQSVYSEDDSYVILGKPFKFKKEAIVWLNFYNKFISAIDTHPI